MGFFDSFDDDELNPPKRHWLDDWRVQLPVNKQGQLKGDADQSWPPARSKAPWYRIRGRDISLEKPKDGARTGSTSSTRTELNQTKKWSNGKIAFTVRVKRSGPEGVVVFQCRSGADAHELVQVGINTEKNTFNVSMNEGGNKWRNLPIDDASAPIRIECEVKRNKTISLTVNGEKFKTDMKHRYEPRRFNFKFGLYHAGKHVAESKVTDLTWA